MWSLLVTVSVTDINQLSEALLFDFVVVVICLHTSVVICCVLDSCEALC